jgi:hypothetical protein
MIFACIRNVIHTNMPHLNFLTDELLRRGKINYGCNYEREYGL